MNNPIVYVLVNGELNMSAGKTAAQVAHAITELSMFDEFINFSEQVKRTVIVLEAKNQQQMENLSSYLFSLEIYNATYCDEGVNEVSPYSVTAMAVAPIDSDNLEAREIFSAFPLFPKVTKKRSFWRRKR